VDGFLRALFALIAALNAATGAPIDANNMPDRPPIIAPTMERIPRTSPKATLAATEPVAATTAITGTIASMKDGVIVVNGQSITLSSSTQVKGEVKTGATVSVVVKVQSDGALEAETLEVSTDAGTASGTTTPTGQASASPATTETPSAGATQSLGAGSNGTPEPKSTEQAQSSPTANPSAQSTEQSKTSPTPAPQVQPTEQPQANPTQKSSDGNNTTTSGSTPTSGGSTPSTDGGNGD
jgi:Domain of unknown function (DUF5666)